MSQPTQPDPAAEWRDRLAAEAAGAWVTSNATYRDEDGGTDRYGIDWTVLPGGMAGTACLWGERDGEITVYWYFSRLWDPVEQRGIVHQSSGAGAIAIGYQDGDPAELVQVMVQPNGGRMEIRHLTEFEGDDVRIDRSFQRPIGAAEWTEGRTYRWVRGEDVDSPCKD